MQIDHSCWHLATLLMYVYLCIIYLELVTFFSELKEMTSEKIKVVMGGPCNVGKTSMLTSFATG